MLAFVFNKKIFFRAVAFIFFAAFSLSRGTFASDLKKGFEEGDFSSAFSTAKAYSPEEMVRPLRLLRQLNGEAISLGGDVSVREISWKDIKSGKEIEVARISEENCKAGTRVTIALSNNIADQKGESISSIKKHILNHTKDNTAIGKNFQDKEFIFCGFKGAAEMACTLAKEFSSENRGDQETNVNQVKVIGVSSLPLLKKDDIDDLYKYIKQENIVFIHDIMDSFDKSRRQYFSGKEYMPFGTPIVLLPFDRFSCFFTNLDNKKLTTVFSWSLMAYLAYSQPDLSTVSSLLSDALSHSTEAYNIITTSQTPIGLCPLIMESVPQLGVSLNLISEAITSLGPDYFLTSENLTTFFSAILMLYSLDLSFFPTEGDIKKAMNHMK